MEISVASGHGDVSVVGVGLGPDMQWDPGARDLVAAMGESLASFLEMMEITGESGQVAVFPAAGVEGVDRLVVIGVGAVPGSDDLRRAAGVLARQAAKATAVATTLATRPVDGAAQAVTEGFVLGSYRFDRYKSSSNGVPVDRFVVIGADQAEVDAGRVVAGGVALARDLINTPAADMAPSDVVARARQAGGDTGIRTVVHDAEAFERERFGGLQGVSAGSHRPACMMELWYEPEDPMAFVALVGKGITFDSGGLSIKPAAGMETMKTDMSGAAAVIGTIVAVAGLRLPIRVLAVTPLTDNMPGGSAVRPGDVLTIRNGKTIEVLNTDAEGRLVLADGLVLADEHEPDVILDLATLTGACKVALGEKIAGGFGTDSGFLDRVVEAGAAVGERIWPLPLPDDYRKLIDSPIADMKNTGGRFGGAITAALLLREFVGEVPWVHLDIAGPARWPEEEHYQSMGGSGFGVRTLVELLSDIGENGL